MLRLTLVIAATLTAMPVTKAAVLTGPVSNPANGNTYYLLESASWTASQAEAESLGGNLVTIDNANENQWVLSTFGNFDSVDRHLWIGYNDADTEGTFVWQSGEIPGFENWAPGQPDSAGGLADEDYAFILHPNHPQEGGWVDFQNLSVANGVAIYGVVEVVVPEPSALVLFGAGLLGIAALRRR